MEITVEELQRRLNSTKNLTNIIDNKTPEIIIEKNQEKALESEKIILGTLSSIDGTDKTATEFGLDPGDLKKDSKDLTIQPKVEYSLVRMRDLALEKTMVTLGLITNDRLEQADLRTLVNTASIMSKIVERTMPKDSGGPNVSFNFYVPEVRSDKDFPVIDIVAGRI